MVNYSSKLVILLTCTIDPGRCIGVKQILIKDRIESYYRSFKQWIDLDLNIPIYIIESSGYGNPFNELGLDLVNHPYITYHSMKLPMIGIRGKGYGEANIQSYFLKELVTDPNSIIIKFTGRWAPLSKDSGPFKDLLEYATALDTNTYNNESAPVGVVKFDFQGKEALTVEELEKLTRWFVLKQSVFNDFIEWSSGKINDMKGPTGWYEHVFFTYFRTHTLMNLKDQAIDVIENHDGSFNKPSSLI